MCAVSCFATMSHAFVRQYPSSKNHQLKIEVLNIFPPTYVGQKLGRQSPLQEFNFCKSSDYRIKSQLTISNLETHPPLSFDALVLCDGGAEGDRITMPARKISQLRLSPLPPAFGGTLQIKNGKNSTSRKLVFPQITVELRFMRAGSDDIETRTVLANPICLESDWNSVVAQGNSCPIASSALSMPSSPSPDYSSPVPPSAKRGGRVVVAAMQLSSIGHRMRYEVCAVGEGLLRILGAHSNHVLHILEIEEQDYEEE